MAPRGPMNFRAQRSAQMLSEDEQLSFQEIVKYTQRSWNWLIAF